MATTLLSLILTHQTVLTQFIAANENSSWNSRCQSIPSESILSPIKICVTTNGSLPKLDDIRKLSEWIDQFIQTTNCSSFLSTSMTNSQKRLLSLIQSSFLFILSLPFLFKLNMTEHQLSQTDQDELKKFTTFFLVKAAQVIVQSRLGERKSTRTKPGQSGGDWFYLSIKDIPEVTVNTKKCLEATQTLLIDSPHIPFCVEISLRTPDGDAVPLETWCISFDDSTCDSSQRVRWNIYNRMSIVLRSLLACTRATPTYQLSRKQSAEKYIICYKMYSGEPIVSHLGGDYSKKTIGFVVTPIGRFVLNVAYRTRLTMSTISNENGMSSAMTQFEREINDNHFSKYRNSNQIDDFARDNDAQLPSETNSSVPKSSPIGMNKQRYASSDSVSSSHGTPDKVFSKLRAAFATPGLTTHPPPIGSYSRLNDNDLPFVLMMQQPENHSQQQSSVDEDQQQESSSKNNDFLGGDSENETAPDDFILVEVKPFFGRSDSTDDLALFIRSCQQPPMLESFTLEPSLNETINQLNEELRVFESKVEEFDQLVGNLEVDQRNTLYSNE